MTYRWIFTSFLLGLSLCSFSTFARPPAQWFFSSPDMVAATLSKSGKHTAAIRIVDSSQRLVLINNDSGDEKILLNTEDYTVKESSIRDFYWLDNRYIAVQFSELKEGIEDLLDTKVSRRLLIVDTLSNENNETQVLGVRTKGWLAHPLKDENAQFLYAKSSSYSKLYKVDTALLAADKKKLGKMDKVDGGQFKKSNEIRSVSGFAVRWFFDRQGKVKAVLNFDRSSNMHLTEFQGEEENILKTWESEKNKKEKKEKKGKKGKKNNKEENNDEKMFPVALADEESTFYCLDVEEDVERSVYRVNFASDEKTLVYQTSAYKIIDLILSERGQLIGVKVLKDGIVRYEYIDIDNNIEKKRGEPRFLSILGKSDDNKSILAYEEAHDMSGSFYIVDENYEKKRRLGQVRPQLDGKLKTTLIEDSVAIDGLDIPYLLTLSSVKNSPKSPLIVLPHGGPIGIHDDRYYDGATQFLAASGYSVLRVNFRGSSGYSDELESAGKKEWGGKMLSDILAAVKVTMARPDIDEQRICTAGFSYGGYAATMLMLQNPNIFKCAVNVSGVSDMPLYTSSSRMNKKQRKWMIEHVGDPIADFELLKSISPVYRIQEVTRPLFIAHGTKDTVVDVEHAHRLSLMMKKHNKKHELYIDEDSGHNFSKPEKRILLFSKIREFITLQIGK